MKRKTIVTMTVLLSLGCAAQAQSDQGPKCTNETLSGAYGIQFHAVRPIQFVPVGKPGFIGQPEQVEGSSVRVYDGKGNFTQSESSKGTTTGYIPARPGRGTYVVNPDCSVDTTVQIAPGITAVTRGVIVDAGKEILGFTVSPEEAMIRFVGRQMK